MREKWFCEFVGMSNVTELAQTLHEITTGSAWADIDRASQIANALRHALATWQPATIAPAYDAAVKMLIEAAVSEYESRDFAVPPAPGAGGEVR
jgi:hypothetical protein